MSGVDQFVDRTTGLLMADCVSTHMDASTRVAGSTGAAWVWKSRDKVFSLACRRTDKLDIRHVVWRVSRC